MKRRINSVSTGWEGLAHVRAIFNQTFSSTTYLGGYTKIYLDPDDNILCGHCAFLAYMEGTEINAQTYDEGAPLFCDECNMIIESTYGNPSKN